MGGFLFAFYYNILAYRITIAKFPHEESIDKKGVIV